MEKLRLFFFNLMLRWRLRKKSHQEEMCLRFSSIEADSAWQILQVLEATDDDHLKVDLFGHYLEEISHSERFYNLAKTRGVRPLRRVTWMRESIREQMQEEWKTLVYFTEGEAVALKRFQTMAKCLPPGDMKKVVQGIVADEVGHVHDNEELMNETGKSLKEIKEASGSIRRLRFYEAWLRQGQKIMLVPIGLLLGLTYFIMGPFVYLSLRVFDNPLRGLKS